MYFTMYRIDALDTFILYVLYYTFTFTVPSARLHASSLPPIGRTPKLHPKTVLLHPIPGEYWAFDAATAATRFLSWCLSFFYLFSFSFFFLALSLALFLSPSRKRERGKVNTGRGPCWPR